MMNTPYISSKKQNVTISVFRENTSSRSKRGTKFIDRYIANLKQIYKPFKRPSPEKPKLRKESVQSKRVARLPKPVSLKDSVRKKEWSVRTKKMISSQLSSLINSSNGLSVTAGPSYKYFVGKGNNRAIVKKVLGSRPWWSSTESELESHLLWTQVINTEYIQSVPLVERKPNQIDPSEQSLECTIDPFNTIDTSSLGFNLILRNNSYLAFTDIQEYSSINIKLHNKLENHFELSDKKFLFLNMKSYYEAIGKNVFEFIPLTFHLENNTDPLLEEVKSIHKPSSIWILKPGENSNRGNGIIVTNSLQKIEDELSSNPFPQTGDHTFIIQQYLENPLLINKRKFDIRCFGMVTSMNGIIQAYFYNEGYLRTASKEYNPLNLTDKFIHLTNDAVQKKCQDYGKYESGNKLSFGEFQRYLDQKRLKVNFIQDIVPKIKEIVKDTVNATFMKLDKKYRAHSFEILGYDFMIDQDFKPWLIEVNTNPCLDISSPLLGRIIPALLENSFKIAVDPLFPEPSVSPRPTSVSSLEPPQTNKYELIFHESIDGQKLYDKLYSKGTVSLVYN